MNGLEQAACRAFTKDLEEDVGPGLIPYLEPFQKKLVFAVEKDQHTLLRIMADAVGLAAQALTYVFILMSPLSKCVRKNLSDATRTSFPLHPFF